MTEHKVKHHDKLSRGDAAQVLSEIARQLGEGPTLVLQLGEQQVSHTVPEHLQLEVEVKTKGDGVELELELSWFSAAQDLRKAPRQRGDRR